MDYCDTEWFALEMNRDHSIIFEIASKYCILDSFVDHDGYAISSKGFLPTGVFPTQGLNPGPPHCRQTLYCLSLRGSHLKAAKAGQFY